MTIEQVGKYAAAILAISAVIAGPVAFFQTKDAAAASQKEQAKSVNELRAEMYLARVKQINDKAEPTKDELDEKARLLALVQAIEAEAKVKK